MLIETDLPNILHRGKVRDTYAVDNDTLLMVATDRISAFDVVLPSGIPSKGQVLNRISSFWFDKTAHIIPNHFLCLADSPDLKSQYGDNEFLTTLPLDIARQAMIVRKAERIDIECIVRGYITGQAWLEYRRQGTVWGLPMPSDMVEGTPFHEPLFTPTTKAEEGHDENISVEHMAELIGHELTSKLQNITLEIYNFAHEFALNKGIIIADTKLEFGLIDGNITLIDELLTPDSSRFWDKDGYQPGSIQPNFDKQFVRDWLNSQKWDREPPAPNLPAEIVSKTAVRYEDAFVRITGRNLK